MASSVAASVIRLSQMHHVAVGELAKERDRYNQMVESQASAISFMETQLAEIRKGLDDLVSLLGIDPPLIDMTTREPRTGEHPYQR